VKDFADKLFSLQLKTSATRLTGLPADESHLNAQEKQTVKADKEAILDSVFIKYFKDYYAGKFVDRMSVKVDKPVISKTIPDADIAGALTVLLEFAADTIDPTPVMGTVAADAIDDKTTFYPGGATNKPTFLVYNPSHYEQIPTDPTVCGITEGNAWILGYLANTASDETAAVGGLIANTPGGLSIGLGIVGKISIGDNQTLSVIVKTAASRLAERVTLASSYWLLRNVKFDIQKPGS
jgi:hypothetical protein